MKSLMGLLTCILADASIWCRASTTRDLVEIERRVKYEGLSFLTITLPNFAKDFERSLELGSADSLPFTSFKRRKGRRVPEFLKELTGQIFNLSTGNLLSEPSELAISYVRQICLMHKKVKMPCSSERDFRAFQSFWKCEHEVSGFFDNELDGDRLASFRLLSKLLYGPRLQGVNHAISDLTHVPRHGPGATADRISGNSKFDQRLWHRRLETFFPSDAFLIPNAGYVDSLEDVNFIEPGDEQPVRVITVPKTLKTPRIIAIEPLCMQYAQQSILELLVPSLEQPSFCNALGFTDQTENQRRAEIGSRDGSLATLDLSEASDRVHNQLVWHMLSSVPVLRDASFACRSMRADVPHFGVITLAKFASMGSALCFPMEAMAFLAISILGIMRAKNVSLSKKSIDSILPMVRVYGDDIIIPTEYAQSVIDELHAFGMKVNDRKSFKQGKFRESCGKDAYNGIDVTPTYVTRMPPQSPLDASEIVSWIELRNSLYMKGLWRSASWITKFLKKFAKIPWVASTSPISGYISKIWYEVGRYNRSLFRYEVKGPVLTSKPRTSRCSGVGALMKFFLKRGSDPFADVKHLERHGRPLSVDIKTRWAVPL